MVKNYNLYNQTGSLNDQTFNLNSIKNISLIEKYEGFFVIKVENKIFRTKLPDFLRVHDQVLARIINYNPFTISLNNFLGYNALEKVVDRVVRILAIKPDEDLRTLVRYMLVQNMVIIKSNILHLLDKYKSGKNDNIFIPSMLHYNGKNAAISLINPGIKFAERSIENNLIVLTDENTQDTDSILKIKDSLSRIPESGDQFDFNRAYFSEYYNYPAVINIVYKDKTFRAMLILSPANVNYKYKTLFFTLWENSELLGVLELEFLVSVMVNGFNLDGNIFTTVDICTLVDNYHSGKVNVSHAEPNVEKLYKTYGYNPFDLVNSAINHKVRKQSENEEILITPTEKVTPFQLLSNAEISLVYILIRESIRKHVNG